MYKQLITLVLILKVFVVNSEQVELSQSNDKAKSTVYEDRDEGKSSLVFVFDTTGSMYNDLKQLREGAEMILKTALKEGNMIADFVFVPFHDPAVGPATVTRDKEVFKSALNIVRVYGGGDCPEKSLGGIQLALNVSRPHSYVYVFTDATAGDHRLVGKVLDTVQRKQSQIVFVLTGHCNDLHKPSYKVYQQIAAASSGQVFNLNKTNVHNVLDFVRSSIRGRTVNLGSVVHPAGYNYTQEIPVDSSLGEVTVSVSGSKPTIKVVNPSGEEVTGPPKLVTALDLSEIMVVKVLQPEPGNWTITTGSEETYSVKVVGLSNLTFNHGFSVEKPAGFAETSYRPLQGTYNHMLISLTQIDRPVQINFAEILSLDGKALFEIPLKEFDRERRIYVADAFVPPDDFFYIAINGHDEYNQELRRIGATAVQAKAPDVPYLTVPRKVEAHSHERVVLKCNVESLVPVTAMWTMDSMRIQPQISSLQSTSLEFVIEDMQEQDVGTYRCVAQNVAGLSRAITDVTLLVDPPQISISPGNTTVRMGGNLTVSCTVVSEALLTKFQLIFNDSQSQYVTEIHVESNTDGVYIYNNTISNIYERDRGTYSCTASNRGGESSRSTYITVEARPTAQILGPHTIPKLIHSDLQLVCNVENADRVAWIAPNGTIVKTYGVAGSFNGVLDVRDVVEEGAWVCVASRETFRVTDSVEIILLMKPEVSIEGPKNVTILLGSTYDVTCRIKAKPAPRILWHKETERFLNNTITQVEPNVYKSVLRLDTMKEGVKGTYFCFGENSQGIHQDSVVVNVRRKMTLIEGFTDKSVQLYSQVELSCRIDSHPPPYIQWYHNGTVVDKSNNIHTSQDGATLYLQKVEFSDLGVYSCVADNGFEKLKVEGRLNAYGLESPLLSNEPARITMSKGKSALITCRVMKGNPEPTLAWQYRNNASEYFTALPHDVIIRNDNVLNIMNVDVQYEGVYRCVAENVVGRDVYDVLMVVQYPPELTTDTIDIKGPMEVEAGQKVTFSCTSSGNPPPIVIWTRNEQPITFSKNMYITDSELVIQKTTEYDSGSYTCNITSALGSLQKNFTLVVYVPPIITKPEIEPQLEVIEGQLVELPCAARGVPTPEVVWLQNGQLVTEQRKYMDEFGLRFVANLTDFGEYTCVARNKYGNTTLTFDVYIWVPPYIEPPYEPTQDVLVGSNLMLNCSAVGFPIPIILWEFKNEILTENTTDLSFNDVGNVFIKNANTKHEGVYICIAENIAGVAKKSIYLNVNEPPKIVEDNYRGPYIATNRDTEMAISCRATGKPKPYIVWSKDNLYLDKDSQYDIDNDGTLTIKSPSEELSGSYTCVAKNKVGQANKTVSVEIYSLPTRMQADESHTKITVLEGTNASIECPIRASISDKVKWYKDANLISHGNLRIPNITRNNSSSYACVVTNLAGSAYSAVTLDVEWPPAFVDVATRNVEVVKGGDWYFDCGTDAKPIAKTKWLFNSRLMLGEDKDRLKLINIQLHHTGTYKCVVSNTHGTVTRQFTLDVLEPPFISEFDLLDVQLKEGVNATLECNARGSPTPEIKWTFNNTNWHLENYTLTTTNISSTSEGLYRCDALNKAGTAHLVYRVTVVMAAGVKEVVVYRGGRGETVEGGVQVMLGTHIRLSCAAFGKPTPNIRWVRSGDILSENREDISYADLILDGVKTSHGGVYSCVVSNEAGLDGRKIKLDVLEPPRIFQTLFHNSNDTKNTTQLEVISGLPFYLHCHPYGNPLPEIYWFRDGLPLRFFDDTMVSTDYGEIITAVKATYDQAGNYTCVARNKVGEASIIYLVDVLVPPPIPKETSKQMSTRVGNHLNLTCPVEGSPLPYIMWVKHPYTEIGEETPRVQLVNDNFTLLINKTEVSDSGKYSCILTNKVGTTEIIFDVTILKPPSVTGGSDVTNHVVAMRRSVVLKCQTDGNPVPKINWLKDTQQLSDNLSNIQRVLGNSLLTIWSAGTRDAGQYICVVENTAGTAHKRYNVVVHVPGKWTAWSQWSLCNVTCGLGYQHRSRLCNYIDDYNVTYDKATNTDKIILDDSACKGPTNDRRKCHMPACEEDETQMRWSPWSKWSQCSSSCGVGTQARARRCRSKAKCYGDNVQIRKCPDLPQCSNNPAENEVFTSNEDTTGTSAYIPEATFEMQPEVVNPDIEEFYIKPEPKYTAVYHDVNVTENLDGSDRGPCDPGFRHNVTTQDCDDVDECLIEKNQCHLTQTCVNTAGGYQCTCLKGFVSLGPGQRCLDINECEQDIHRCQYACVNVAGGYVCACPRNLRLHPDKHHCVTPSSYRKPHSYEELETEDYLSTAIDFPARYMKNTRN